MSYATNLELFPLKNSIRAKAIISTLSAAVSAAAGGAVSKRTSYRQLEGHYTTTNESFQIPLKRWSAAAPRLACALPPAVALKGVCDSKGDAPEVIYDSFTGVERWGQDRAHQQFLSRDLFLH